VFPTELDSIGGGVVFGDREGGGCIKDKSLGRATGANMYCNGAKSQTLEAC